ncbi:pimeloyl-ACP methyl ester carboxylesterase [Rheinheimera pacifica]|uniref:alpha/beta fold hydrolase n=1 Tax=Rheinheimera pacifica TaxID=173990 RepID=UPI0028624C83|nr:alpha/beta hydrolase [Rheinheimera pacifica]MDR6984962.1 pimeloyl-ACP methyl ester carboxylesterase [Rheinheimera pacifica]
MRIFTTIVATAMAYVFSVPAFAQTSYGARLEGFDYPFEVKNYQLLTQGQKLEMAYMDVAPVTTANGKTAVLLHGKNFCAATWHASIKVLTRQGYRVVVPDQLGFCKSNKPQGYQFSLAQLAANTHSLLNSIGVTRPVVIGHSMGGMLTARYALQYPDDVEKIVLVNPIGLEDWQAEGVPYATIDALYANELKTSFDSIKAYQLKFYYDGNWKPEYEQWVNMQAGLYTGAGKDIVAMNQAQTSEMIFTQPVVHEFANIRVPAVLIIGGKDRTAPGANRASKELAAKLGNYPQLGRAAAKAMRAKLVELPKLGHSPQVEAEQEFHQVLLKHLAD